MMWGLGMSSNKVLVEAFGGLAVGGFSGEGRDGFVGKIPRAGGVLNRRGFDRR